MARIPVRISGRGLDTGSPVQYSGRSPIGEALEGVGDRLSALNDIAMRRKKQDEAFSAEQTRQQGEQQYNADLMELQQKLPADGAGLHDDGLRLLDQRQAEVYKTVPDRLKPKFGQMFETQRMAESNRLAGLQNDRRKDWFRQGIASSVDDATNRIVTDPTQFEVERQKVFQSLETSGLDAMEIQARRKEIENKLSLSAAKVYQQRDPEYLRDNLGVARAGTVLSPGDPSLPAGMRNHNPGNLKYSERVRSRFKGVVGPSQNTDQGDPQAVFETPEDGMRAMYELARGKYEGGKRTANQLIAGRGGWTPGNREAAANVARTIGINPDDDLNLTDRNGAAKFLRALMMQEHGKASAAYSDEMIVAAIDGPTTGTTKPARDLPVTGQGGRSIDLDGVQPLVTDRFIALQNQFGRILPVSSGFRDPEKNAAVGGAKGSQHMHGNALDVDVSHLDIDERKHLIGMASAMGFTGVGVYDNALHLDMGPRRAWGPDHHGESVPAWAQGAVQAHLSGDPDAAADGAPLASRQTPLDPRFAGLTFSQRLELANQTDNEIQQRQRQQAAADKAAFEAYKDTWVLRAVMGEATEQEAFADPILNQSPGDLVTVVRSIREGKKKATETELAVNDLLAGNMKDLNPRDGEQMSRLDRAYNEVVTGRLKDAPQEERDNFTMSVIRTARALPQKVQATLEAGILDPKDPKDAAGLGSTLESAVALEDQVPTAYLKLDTQARKEVASYRHYTRDLGLDGQAAADRIIADRQPQAKDAEKVFGPDADKFAKSLRLSDVQAGFSSFGWTGFSYPGTGALPQQSAQLLAEFQDAARQEVLRSGGSSITAKARALEDIKDTWGISTISGAPQLAKLPPEKRYPEKDGSYDWIREDAIKTVKERTGANVENVFLVADGATAQDFNDNRPPSYALLYTTKEDGPDAPHFAPTRWAMPDAELKTMRDADEAKRRAEAEAEFDRADSGITSMRNMTAGYDITSGAGYDASLSGQMVPQPARKATARAAGPMPEIGTGDPFGGPGTAERLKQTRQQLQQNFKASRSIDLGSNEFMRRGR